MDIPHTRNHFKPKNMESLCEGDNIILTQMQTAKIMDPFKVLHKDKHLSGDEIFNHLIQYANSHNISFYTLDPDNYLTTGEKISPLTQSLNLLIIVMNP